MKSIDLKNYLDEVGALVFQRIVVRVLPTLNKHGVFLHHLQDNIELPEEVIKEMDHALHEIYKIRIPSNLIATKP